MPFRQLRRPYHRRIFDKKRRIDFRIPMWTRMQIKHELTQRALKTRQRQHDARARIEELHESQERLRTALLYGIGGVAAYWSWLRVAAVLA